ncbi:MAG: nucleotide exchange factor GrpE [Gammaproteobacteria bacterium]|nr:nucleotide exchange factor GrpE [Gammaproteobacteria bacterium]
MDKASLLQAFATYLDQSSGEASEDETKEIDLHTLFTEMAALRTEVRTESRQFKTALEEFHSYSTLLGENQRALEQSQRENRSLIEEQLQGELKELLLNLLEIYDRMAVGLESLNGFKPGLFGGKKALSFIGAMAEGQGITLRRIEQLLERQEVSAIPALGEKVNPRLMKVVEVVEKQGVDDGVVTAEYKKGFIWRQKLLRTAEVAVNKVSTAEG